MNRSARLRTRSACFALCMHVSGLAWAAPPLPTIQETQKLSPLNSSPGAFFGSAVGFGSQAAVIGAPGDSSVGAAFIFEPGGSGQWQQTAKLTVANPAINDYLGGSAAISGTTAIVGAPFEGASDAGAAFLFQRNGAGAWPQIAKLTATETAGDLFGGAVGIDGLTALVGNSLDDARGTNSGAVFVYKPDVNGNWNQFQKLTGSDGTAFDFFGASVAISGNSLIIGATGDEDGGSSTGSAYIFRRNDSGEWIQFAKLHASDALPSDNFGYSVDISENLAIVGSPNRDDHGSNSGAAYVFRRNPSNVWTQVAKLTAGDGAENDAFGLSVSIDGGLAVVGADSNDSEGQFNRGAAYIYASTGPESWPLLAKLVASDGDVAHYLGESVAVHGQSVLVGAMFESSAGENTGAAYLVQIPEPSTLVMFMMLFGASAGLFRRVNTRS